MTRLSDLFEGQRMRPAAPTRWWYATLALGIATALFGLHLSTIFPQSGHALDPSFGAPVLAFEFARGQDDLIAIFGPGDDPMQIARLAMMRTGNEQDYLYMLLYAGFLFSGLMALWRDLRLRPLLAAAGLPILAALCDAYENWLLFDIQAAYTADDYSPAMAGLRYPVVAKFLLLAATNVAIGLGFAQIGRWWALAGTLVIVATVPTLLAVTGPENFGWTLLAAIGGGWIALIGAAAIASWRAMMHRRPLVDYSTAMPRTRPAAPSAPSPSSPGGKTFGRRRS